MAVQVKIQDESIKKPAVKALEEVYQNSDKEDEDFDEEDEEKATTPQKNPVFDKYVDTQLLVGPQAKPNLKSSGKPPSEYVEKNPTATSKTDANNKEEQVKTSYYALATGK